MSTPTRPMVSTSSRAGSLPTRVLLFGLGVPADLVTRLVPYPPPPRDPRAVGPCQLSRRQQEVQARPVLSDVHNRAAQHASRVVTAGIHAERPAEPLHAARLVNVAVQRDGRLVLLDGVADGVAADR